MNQEPVLAFVALGSNLGDRRRHLAMARERLRRLPGTILRSASSIEETDPLGGLEQPRYLNQMVVLQTSLSPRELLTAFHGIEAEVGRGSHRRWESRTLDLDLVLYGDKTIDEPGLQVPHPGLPSRDFWRRELDELRVKLSDIGYRLSGVPNNR